jgi:exonuclease III
MEATLRGMKNHLDQADETPVFLVGDFNAPSHLDWVDGLKEKNCGYSNVRWPTSVLPEEAGLIDSFRVANPDPVKVQGTTWSPVTIWNNANRREPQDRIDFILHKGKSLKVTDSHTVVVGKPLPIPDTKYNEWFSDHAAVLTTYELE